MPDELSSTAGLDPRKESYDAELRCDSFPVNRFLPADSLGMLALSLTARGAGFDPFQTQTRTSLRAQIDHAEYRGYDFGGIGLEADLEEQHISGALSDRNEALRLSLLLSGMLTEEQQQVRIAGKIADFDLAQMGFTPERIGGSFLLDASASATVGAAMSPASDWTASKSGMATAPTASVPRASRSHPTRPRPAPRYRPATCRCGSPPAVRWIR